MDRTPLTGKDRSHLRGLAHHLEPVVLTGANGVSEAVLAKVSTELDNHELIKVRVSPDGPVGAAEAAPGLAEACGAELVQVIGHIVVLYRRAKERKVFLPGEKPPRPKRPHAAVNKAARRLRAASGGRGPRGGGRGR